jgi:Family of unknown function (DUF6295)
MVGRSIASKKRPKALGWPCGQLSWMRIDTANVYFDHPYHAPFSHALAIDFVCEANGAPERVAVELSADAARALVKSILAALASGEATHAA